MRSGLYITILCLISLYSCRQDSLQRVMSLAGKNGVELQKVLDHYSVNEKDTLKYKAAIFLIENMIYHSGIDQVISVAGERIDCFNWADYDLDHLLVQDTKSLLKLKQAVDSLGIKIKAGERKWDVKTIKAQLLIENIDYAFKAWEIPWCRHLNFEDFCEYILSYRCQTEPLTQWRRRFYEKYKWIVDSLPADCDPLKAAIFMREVINKEVVWLPTKARFYSGFLAPGMFEQVIVGNCGNLSVYTSLAMRSVGIPVTYDWVLYWSGRNSGHAFNCVVVDDSIKGYLFNVCDGPPSSAVKPHKATRIMRTTYKMQDNPLWDLWVEGASIPTALISPYKKDVTHVRVVTDTLKIKVEQALQKEQRVWLCTLTPTSLKAFNYSNMGKNGGLCFPEVNKRLVYVLAKYEDGDLRPVSDPFYCQNQSVVYLKPLKENYQNYAFEAKLRMKGQEPDGSMDLDVRYWDNGWVKVEARAEFIHYDGFNKKFLIHEGMFRIHLKSVPQNAFFFMKNSNSWFTFNADGNYQTR